MPQGRDTPVRPAFEGTHRFSDEIGGVYTAGEPAIDAIRKISEHHDTIAVDTETFGLGLDALDLKSVQMGTTDHAVVLDPRDPAQRAEIAATFSRAREIVFHNAAFDVPGLVHNKLMTLDDTKKVTDTLIYSRLADPGDRSGLAAAAARHLGTADGDVLQMAFKSLGLSRADGYLTFDIDRPIYLRGAATDVIMTARLLPAVRAAAMRMLTEDHPFSKFGVTGAEAEALREREQIVNRVFLKRFAKGLRIDFEFLDRYREETMQQKVEAENRLAQYGITPGNGNHLTAWLEEAGHLPADHPRTATGKASATAAVLETLEHPLARVFVQHKKIAKIEDDYLNKCADLASVDGRIHPMLSILGAATGRMSLGNPPLQQFNGPARGIIIPEEGRQFTSIDWSQIEPVVAANIARDTKVLEGYENGTSDLYTDIASTAGISRKEAKVVVLAQMYGEGLAKLGADLNIGVEAAEQLKYAVFRAMPQTAKLLQKLRTIAREHQKVFTVSGRIVPVPMGMYQGEQSIAAHKGPNYFVQGSAYDVLADAIVEAERQGLSDAIHLPMHDELIVDTEAARDIEKIMQTPSERLCFMAGRTPVLRTDTKDLGERWATA